MWISALIPKEGADCYDGIRLQASATEKAAYRDLAEWMESEGGESLKNASVKTIREALDSCPEILTWKVEKQEIAPAVARRGRR